MIDTLIVVVEQQQKLLPFVDPSEDTQKHISNAIIHVGWASEEGIVLRNFKSSRGQIKRVFDNHVVYIGQLLEKYDRIKSR